MTKAGILEFVDLGWRLGYVIAVIVSPAVHPDHWVVIQKMVAGAYIFSIL